MIKPSSPTLLLSTCVLLWAGARYAMPDGDAATLSPSDDRTAGASTDGAITNAPLAPWRVELLELGFAAASALPADGHGKDRATTQETVVSACFELDQPRRALAFAHEIENWRRGSAYADFAFYCAERGNETEGRHFLELAREIALTDPLAVAQEWRRDRVFVKIARTYTLLGELEEAKRYTEGVGDAEVGKVDRVFVRDLASEDFDEYLASLDHVLTTGSFDRVRNTLGVCVELHERFYADAERRALLEERVRTSYEKLPLMARINLMEDLIRTSLDNDDAQNALALMDAVDGMVAHAMWSPEYRVPLLARTAELRFLAGQPDAAVALADRALELFDAEREDVVGIFRCETLLPLADAYATLGQRERALETYARALREGADNPNGRPRAMDLAAVCVAMALQGVEPDAELAAALSGVRAGLAAPW